MAIALNAAVQCTDGPGGRISHIIVNPIAMRVTHLGIEEQGITGTEVIVPIETVAESHGQQVRLKISRSELTHMPTLVETAFLKPGDSTTDVVADATLLWPYRALMGLGSEDDQILPHEHAVHRGSHVEAKDGRVGQVSEFLVDPRGGITHIVLRKGHLWNKADVTIPVRHIKRIVDGVVYLKLNIRQVDALPAVQQRGK